MRKITLLLSLIASIVLGYSQSDDFTTKPNTLNEPVLNIESKSVNAPCFVSVSSNSFEYAIALGGTTEQRVAIDIDVPAGETFTLNKFVPNLIGGTGTTYKLIIYEILDNGTLDFPITIYNHNITSSSALVGIITVAGYPPSNVYEVTLLLNSPQTLDGRSSGTKYALELVTDAPFWETTTATTEGFVLGVLNNAGTGGQWILDPNGAECVYYLVGDCSDSVNSISDLKALGFNYYPNPVSNDLFLTARENISNVTIFNMLGQEVKNVVPSSLETTINMSNLVANTYFVRVQIGDTIGTFKVVKK